MSSFEEKFETTQADVGPDFNLFENWVTKNYGGNTRTKTITREKHDKICKLIRGDDPECNAKFRFWVRNKGFQLITHNKETDEVVNDNINGQLYISLHAKEEGVPMGERSIENFLRTNLPAISFFRKVAVVDKFYQIIKKAHIDRNHLHAGQKKTYRLVSDTYAFLPREVITFYLLHCGTCKPRIQKYGPVPKVKKQPAIKDNKLTTHKQGQQKSYKQQTQDQQQKEDNQEQQQHPQQHHQQQQQQCDVDSSIDSSAVSRQTNHIYRPHITRISSQTSILPIYDEQHFTIYDEQPPVHILDEHLDLMRAHTDLVNNNTNEVKSSSTKTTRKRHRYNREVLSNSLDLTLRNDDNPRIHDHMFDDMHYNPSPYIKKMRQVHFEELMMREMHTKFITQQTFPREHVYHPSIVFAQNNLSIRKQALNDSNMLPHENHPLALIYKPHNAVPPSSLYGNLQDELTVRYGDRQLPFHQRFDSVGNDIRDNTSDDSLSPKDGRESIYIHSEFHPTPMLVDHTKINNNFDERILPLVHEGRFTNQQYAEKAYEQDMLATHHVRNKEPGKRSNGHFNDGRDDVCKQRRSSAAMDSSVAQIHQMVVERVNTSLKYLSHQPAEENIKIPSQQSISNLLKTYKEFDEDVETTDGEDEDVEIM